MFFEDLLHFFYVIKFMSIKLFIILTCYIHYDSRVCVVSLLQSWCWWCVSSLLLFLSFFVRVFFNFIDFFLNKLFVSFIFPAVFYLNSIYFYSNLYLLPLIDSSLFCSSFSGFLIIGLRFFFFSFSNVSLKTIYFSLSTTFLDHRYLDKLYFCFNPFQHILYFFWDFLSEFLSIQFGF